MLLLDKLSELVKVVHQSLHHNDIEYHGNTTRDIKDRENRRKMQQKKDAEEVVKKGSGRKHRAHHYTQEGGVGGDHCL